MSKHDHDCNCGCNEEVTVTLTLDNDEELECAVLTIYEVDGKEYKHVKIGKYYDTNKYDVGMVIKVTVNPDSLGKPMVEGGTLCVVGFLLVSGGIISKIKSRKRT